jgi:hypothetical protein
MARWDELGCQQRRHNQSRGNTSRFGGDRPPSFGSQTSSQTLQSALWAGCPVIIGLGFASHDIFGS